jgi:hypothetical protein
VISVLLVSAARGQCVICVQFMHNGRDCLRTFLITIGMCWIEDGSDYYSCDRWPDHDEDVGYEDYWGAGTLKSLNVKKVKNYQHHRDCRKRYCHS